MKLGKSFVMRIFLIMLVTLLLLMTISSIGIYSYSRRIVGTEFLRLNEASVNHLAASAGTTLDQLYVFAEKMAGNSRILELSLQGENGAEEVRSILVNALSDFNAAYMSGANLIETYILTGTGLEVSGFNSGRFTWQSIAEDPAFRPLLEGQTNTLLLPTKPWEGVFGIMGHTFQVAVAMQDLFTGENRGIVILDISEVTLHQQLRRYQNRDNTVCIMTKEGEILSARNKREIGSRAAHTQEELAARSLDDQIAAEDFVSFGSIPQTEWLLVMKTPTQTVFSSLKNLRNVSLLLTVCSGLAAVALLMLSARSIIARIKRIQDGMIDVVKGDLSVRIKVDGDDEFSRIEAAFNSMVEEINRLIDEARQSERQKHIAQMDFLQAQINSHFIHNTLTSIRFMLEMDQVREAGEMVFYFSKLLRQTLSRSTEFIPLWEELDTLKSYVMLQSYRYQDTFEASFDFEEETLDTSVPVLILQPVVENAIFHGASHGNSHIHICGFRENGNLILTVEDDGQGIPREKLGKILKKDASMNRVGLRNVHQRIQLIYGEKYGLSIDSRLGEGTLVRFTLPMDREGGMTLDT